MADFQPLNQPKNLHLALQYNEQGDAELRVASRQSGGAFNVFVDNQDPIPVTLGSETITIIGNIAVPTTVNVASSAENPVHVHLTEVGSSGLLSVPYMPVGQGTIPWIVVGNVNIAANNGGIEINNDTGNPLRIVGNVNTTVVGTVSVTQGTTPWIVAGNVNVTNIPTVTLSSNAITTTQGTTPWIVVGNVNAVVTGSVAITSIPEVEIKNDSGNPIPISANTSPNSPGNPIHVNVTNESLAITEPVTVNQGTNPWTVTGNLSATIQGEVNVAGANPDAFGRARVSEVFTLGDYKHIYAIDPNFLDSLSNGGTVTFDANQACALLATSSNVNSVAIHQTKFYHHYQPGKSQLIYSSFNFRAPDRNVTKRTGYFDDRDGIYFEQVGSNTADGSVVSPSTQTLNWVIRTYVGGSPNEGNYVTTINGVPYTYKRRVPQTEWNIDRCDGTGGVNNPSGFQLDITKTQLCWIDFQWLGVGRVRCGFVHNGQLITAHEYYNSNVLPTVYISNPNLPVRCEIRNTGTTPGGVMDQICSSVMSEGGYVESGIDWSVYSTARATPTPGQTKLPLIAIRLKNSFNGYPNRLSVRPLSLGLFARTEPVVYEVVKLPNVSSLSTTLNGGVLTWTSADANSGVEYCVNATDYVAANADRFASGYVPAGSSQNSLSPVATGPLTSAKKNIISQNIDSTSSEIYLVVVSTIFTGNQLTADVACSIQWREIY